LVKDSKPSTQVLTTQAKQLTSEQVTDLLGFRDLIAERYGYLMGRRLKQQEMNEKLRDQAKAIRERRKAIASGYEEYFDTDPAKADVLKKLKASIGQAETDMKKPLEALKKAREPFQEVIKPLAQAIRYMDSVVIPDSLTSMGKPVAPITVVSPDILRAIAESKKA
jgi:DNA repair exonuclease SbcCD ATPase subunit